MPAPSPFRFLAVPALVAMAALPATAGLPPSPADGWWANHDQVLLSASDRLKHPRGSQNPCINWELRLVSDGTLKIYERANEYRPWPAEVWTNPKDWTVIWTSQNPHPAKCLIFDRGRTLYLRLDDSGDCKIYNPITSALDSAFDVPENWELVLIDGRLALTNGAALNFITDSPNSKLPKS